MWWEIWEELGVLGLGHMGMLKLVSYVDFFVIDCEFECVFVVVEMGVVTLLGSCLCLGF